MKITQVSPGYCDPAEYHVLVQFEVEGKEGSAYLMFSSSDPKGVLDEAVVGTVIDSGNETDVPYTMPAELEKLVRYSALQYYIKALPYRCEAEQRASGFSTK